MKDKSDDYKAGYRAGQRDMRFHLEHLERLQIRHAAWTAAAMAMREACARACSKLRSAADVDDEIWIGCRSACADEIRRLPIPEEP